METDISIAQKATIKPIVEIGKRIELSDHLIPYGHYQAKVPLEASNKQEKPGKLILVTAMTPTKFGEGKTTNTIGLAQALQVLGKSSTAAIREPSLGPCMGIKGGAAGGGYSQVLPMEDINLHFTGDIHAVTTAHNLLSAMIDNHIHRRAKPLLDPTKVTWSRVMDMNDRSLRHITVGLGAQGKNGQAREDGFEITAASEVMAILCLSGDPEELKSRLGQITIGSDVEGNPVTASDLQAHGAMAALLKHAVKPNLVQSIEGVPVFVHGGPFANIAHGCSSVIATRIAQQHAEYTVTEAGFASELGAEKFFNIVCRAADLVPDAAVIVATLRAYKLHGLENILKHVENIKSHGVPAVVSINRFSGDDPQELTELKKLLQQHEVESHITDFRESGGPGGTDLAESVIRLCKDRSEFHYLYELDNPVRKKIETICTTMYGASSVNYQKGVITKIKHIEQRGFGNLPICMAKTQTSLSDNPKLTGRPQGFTVTVTDCKVNTGAGFIVAYTGEVMTMPGLPKRPSACDIDIDRSGTISGLF